MNDRLSQALINEEPMKIRLAWVTKQHMFYPDYTIGFRGIIERDDVVAYYGREGRPKIGVVSAIMQQSDGVFVKKIPPKDNVDQCSSAPEAVCTTLLICRFLVCDGS